MQPASARERASNSPTGNPERDATEGELAGLCLTRPSGTNAFNIYRGLRLKLDGRPFRVRLVHLTLDELRTLGVPAIVEVRLTGGMHAIVVEQFEGDEVIFHNPLAEGTQRWPVEHFRT